MEWLVQLLQLTGAGPGLAPGSSSLEFWLEPSPFYPDASMVDIHGIITAWAQG